MGRTPLHAVAATGKIDCLKPLLDYGASIHEKDLKGDTPISIARRLHRKNFERKMFVLYWMMKSGKKSEVVPKELPGNAGSGNVRKKSLT